ncbi:UDP-3-O-(3-hydroxymyristoyl)glucosamine N-acyltransferase [bacterium]|nr:UDP-3-O-(3-hydroxymyristoyl)glucosamine N-acyltransferase [bacterium]
MIRLGDIAEHVGGRVAGDPETPIADIAQVDDVRPGEITFAVNAGFLARAIERGAAAVLVPAEFEAPLPRVVVAEARLAAIMTAMLLHPPRERAAGRVPDAHVDADALVDPSATIMPGAYVGAGASIGAGSVLMPGAVVEEDARVGAACVLHPNVTVKERCMLGDRVILHAGVVIGADGFGYFEEGGRRVKIPQLGTVIVEDDVEIGAHSCVDRATIGRTVIGAGTKIDNLVQVGHNCLIGKNCILVSQVGLAGSVRIGDGAILAARAGVADNVAVGAHAVVGGMSGVARDVPEGAQVAGAPAYSGVDWRRNVAIMPDLHRTVRLVQRLSERVEELEAKIASKEDKS